MNVLRTTLRRTAVGLAGALLWTGAALSADPLVPAKDVPGTFSANVALTSEYFFRGITQTNDEPALQGGMDYSVDVVKNVSAYLGVWGSNLDFQDNGEGSVELDLYGGLSGSIGNTGIGWTAGVIYYAYPGANSNLNYDFWELTGGLSYDFGFASVSGSVNWSPDNFGGSGDATYLSFGVDVPVGKYVTLSGHVGHQSIQDNAAFGAPDYVDWSLGAGVNVAGFDLSVAYIDNDISGSEDNGTAVFTVSRSF